MSTNKVFKPLVYSDNFIKESLENTIFKKHTTLTFISYEENHLSFNILDIHVRQFKLTATICWCRTINFF